MTPLIIVEHVQDLIINVVSCIFLVDAIILLVLILQEQTLMIVVLVQENPLLHLNLIRRRGLRRRDQRQQVVQLTVVAIKQPLPGVPFPELVDICCG